MRLSARLVMMMSDRSGNLRSSSRDREVETMLAITASASALEYLIPCPRL